MVKNSPDNAGAAGDTSSIPGSGRPHGRENGNWFQYSCLKNARGVWQTIVHEVKELDMTKHTCTQPKAEKGRCGADR